MTATLFTLFVATTSAPGQLPNQPVQPQKPVISPYLNLLRRGGTPAYNYFTLTQPQLQAQQNFQNLQSQLTALENTPTMGTYAGTGSELFTGKNVGYFTHRQYFMNNGGVQRPNYLTGQQGGGANNSVYQPNTNRNPNTNTNTGGGGSVMPFNR